MTVINGTSVLSIDYASPNDILAASTVLPVLCIIAVLLRFYVRVWWRQGIGMDDWLLVPALLMIIGMGASLIIGVEKHAVGYPTPPLDTSAIDEYLDDVQPEIVLVQQLEFVITLLLVLAYGSIKLSILCFYRRIFVTQKHTALNYLIWISIAIILAWTTAFLFLFVFSCDKSVAANWGSRRDLIIYCGAGHAHELSLYISELVTDIMVLVIPMPMIWRLQMQTVRKLTVSAIFLLAFMALAASIVRLTVTIEITTKSYTIPIDQNLTISTFLYWGTIEASLSLIASCLPTLRILATSQGLHSLLPSTRTTRSPPFTDSSTGPDSSRASAPKHHHQYTAFGSAPSDAALLRGDTVIESQSLATHSVEEPVPMLELGAIRVKREVELREDGF